MEVNRPNRQLRRSHGKSDPVDAVAAARAAQSGQATGQAKTRDGAVEAIRALRVARRSARHGRITAINQMRALLVSGPDDLRETLRGSTVFKLVTTAARLRPADPTTAAGATRFALRELARRVQSLEAECKRLDALLESLVSATAPEGAAAIRRQSGCARCPPWRPREAVFAGRSRPRLLGRSGRGDALRAQRHLRGERRRGGRALLYSRPHPRHPLR